MECVPYKIRPLETERQSRYGPIKTKAKRDMEDYQCFPELPMTAKYGKRIGKECIPDCSIGIYLPQRDG
ncbi:hypothetical protein JTE90_026135 [Oedothorax gibbosus]|uniref:Uncharacterized protein n=1 Tax=Oedothorax gibbosus TaxID=931172 RepID=A0AAV6V1X8_9ARAC|nr:hypothetical protein JTE90_026135 [Oedothorax gibbosus]